MPDLYSPDLYLLCWSSAAQKYEVVNYNSFPIYPALTRWDLEWAQRHTTQASKFDDAKNLTSARIIMSSHVGYAAARQALRELPHPERSPWYPGDTGPY